jgi:hypothetical protein
MIEVSIFLPNVMDTPYEQQYKSIRSAAKALGVTYYFLYNCKMHKHNNQFASFVNVKDLNPIKRKKYVRVKPYKKKYQDTVEETCNSFPTKQSEISDENDSTVEKKIQKKNIIDTEMFKNISPMIKKRREILTNLKSRKINPPKRFLPFF